MVGRSSFDPVEADIFQRRLTKLTLIILIVFGVLFVRLWFLQIIHGAKFRTQSENNRIDLRDVLPFRGLIYDRNGELLVDNRPLFMLGAIPEDIGDPDGLLAGLQGLVEIDRESARKRITRAKRRNPFNPVYIKKGLTRNELARVEANRFNMPGVVIDVKARRHYLYGPFASHLIGYLGEINRKQLNSDEYTQNRPGDFVGKFGIERKWQKQLNGVRGGQQVEVDAYGRRLRVLYQRDAEPGLNVYLTIDKNLQQLAEKALEDKAGAIVAMNPMNGEILAMASSPTFNPNDFAKGMDKKGWEKLVSNLRFPLQNRATTGQYPPGSLFKIVVALAGLEEGVIDPQEKIHCLGSYYFQGRIYRDWREGGHGSVDLHKALVESCDVYFYKMGQRIGIDTIARYARLLGFGQRTGLRLGDEKPGLIPDREWKLTHWHVPWQEGETLSVAVGQSFTLITPIQMARFISALFNGGILYRPQVTKSVGNGDGNAVFMFQPDVIGRWSLRDENMELVKTALLGVVNEPRGTGRRARSDTIQIAGKTGTAQVIALPEEGEAVEEEEVPYKFRDHSWFVAVAPGQQPVIALSIIIEHGGMGGATAAPIARMILEGYFRART
ncbi:MAG: penicillin-binding protein 2 [Deltaproteobacteria bacterium]|nr:penicillin-binding protein 2 [Deltaproteobacteria bacterium]MBW2076025.1 penicillin-binding protein 2 [Deltaproteobacteria bacterium]